MMRFHYLFISLGLAFGKVEAFVSPQPSTFLPTLYASISEGERGSVAAESQSFVPDMKAYAAGYCTVFKEVPCSACTASTGSLPSDLVGTYFRSGPAMFSAGSITPPKFSIIQPKVPPVPDGQDPERMVTHPFDADGGILGITLDGTGNALLRYRYTRTNGMTNERRRGARLYTGMDPTRALGSAGQMNDFPIPMFRHHFLTGLNKKRKNTSNTRTIYWGKKLITLWEGGLPYKLDALALSTEGRSQLGGVLKESDPFCGTAVVDPFKDRLLMYSNKQSPSSSALTVYEFNSKFRLASEGGGKKEVSLPGFAVLSDFTATEKYSVFVQPPISVNGIQFMISKEPGKSVTPSDGPALLHLIPRVGSTGQSRTLEIARDELSDGDLQFVNAYEEDGKIIFDAIRSDVRNMNGGAMSWPWATTAEEYTRTASKKSLWRYTVEGTKVSKEILSDLHLIFPVVNNMVSTRKHRYIYAAVGGKGNAVAPPQGIAKFDCETKEVTTWMPKEYEFCGEPMFASKRGSGEDASEDDGYILTVLFNGQSKQSELVVLNAEKINDGPVARVPFNVGLPHGLYGCFSNAEETGWTEEEISRRAKLADKMEGKGAMWNEVKSDFSGLGLRLDDFEEYFGDTL